MAAALKVLVIIPTLAVGGAEMDLLRVLPRLDRAKFAVDVWTYQDRGELADRMGAAGIRVIGPDLADTAAPAPSAKPRKVGAIWARIRALRHLARKVADGAHLLQSERYDVVHAVLPGSYLVAVLASAVSRQGQVVMSRLSQNWYQADHPLFGWLERHILHRAVSAVIGNAALIVDELRAEGVAERKLSLIRNGLDVGAFDASLTDRATSRQRLGLPAAALVLTAVANLHLYKGYDELIEALALADPQLPDGWMLLVAGSDRDGNMARLQQAARLKGLADRIHFLGPRSDVPLLLSAADIHVTASHSEGLPNNVIEAMFAGLPVVGTAVGGIPELVEDGSTGRLVPPKSATDLARAIIGLAEAPETRRAMGRAGRSVAAARFDVERTVAELSAVYGDVALSHRENRLYLSRQAVSAQLDPGRGQPNG